RASKPRHPRTFPAHLQAALKQLFVGRSAQPRSRRAMTCISSSGAVVADIVSHRRRICGGRIIRASPVNQLGYYRGHIVNIGEVARHSAMVKEPDRPDFAAPVTKIA